MKVWINYLILLIALNHVQAQSSIDIWKRKYNSYYDALSGHKMHVAFNQHKYAVGDTAFFVTHLFENDLTLVKGKRILDFHVINAEGKPIQHFFFSILNGEVHNQWIIPDLPAGIYRVAIHHYGLTAFYPEVIYQQPIEIVKNGVLRNTSQATRITVEGGHLIGDVQNHILIATTPNSSIKLLDQTGEMIAKGLSQPDGFCSLTFKPILQQKYFLSNHADTSRVWLPTVEADGVSLNLDVVQKRIRMKVPVQSKFKNEQLLLILSERNQILEAIDFSLESDSTEFNLTASRWSEGLIHLSVLRKNGELLAYRNFYHQIQITPSIHSLSNDYLPREKVDVEINLKDSTGKPIVGVFSLSVQSLTDASPQFQNGWLDSSFDVDFVNEDFAWADLMGMPATTLDYFVMTRSKPQPWSKILSENNPLKGFRFKSNLQKVGKAYSDSTKKPLPDGSQVLFYLQRAHQRYQFTINKGIILMPMLDFFGADELLVMAETPVYMGGEQVGQVVPNVWIEWSKDEIKWPVSIKVAESSQPDAYATYASQNKVIRKSFETFLAKEQKVIMEDEISGLPTSDISVRITDYEPFADMEELIREIIPALQHRKTRSGSIVLVTLSAPMKVTGDPTYIIDGFATKNTSFFMSLKPAEIATISIVNHPKKLIPLGLFGKNGLVIVKTKSGNVRDVVKQHLIIEGLNRPHLPVMLNPSVRNRVPNFNSFVYWYPSGKLDTNGVMNLSFYTLDALGPYRILLRGISQSGIPFCLTKDINVNLQAAKR
jgi:hypothetical protein